MENPQHNEKERLILEISFVDCGLKCTQKFRDKEDKMVEPSELLALIGQLGTVKIIETVNEVFDVTKMSINHINKDEQIVAEGGINLEKQESWLKKRD